MTPNPSEMARNDELPELPEGMTLESHNDKNLSEFFDEARVQDELREMPEPILSEGSPPAVMIGTPTTGKPTNPKDIMGSLKPNYSFVPVPVLYDIGSALQEGALKYGAYNWRVMGVRASIYFDATRRHLDAWWEGEDVDPDSGLNHITKALSSLVVLRDAMLQGKLDTDDRPLKANHDFMSQGQDRITGLAERFPNPVPGFTQVEFGYKFDKPVEITDGAILGFRVEVQLPGGDGGAPIFMQQGEDRTSLSLAQAVAHALREDGYGERVIRITRVSDRLEVMPNGDMIVDGIIETAVQHIYPGDVLEGEVTA